MAATKATRAIVQQYKGGLKAGGCRVCGYDKCVQALEFHHVSGKDALLSRCHTIDKINTEIDKHPILVLCANCHRELHNGFFEFAVAV